MAYILRRIDLSTYKLIDKSLSLVSHPRLIYLNDKYLYLDIPKSGSSFIKSSIISEGKSLANISKKFPHSAIFKRPLKINSLKNKKIITFIRDPIDRFLSVIRQKIIYAQDFFNGKWSPSKFPFLNQKFNINEVDSLVEKMNKIPIFLTDKHIVPQHYHLRNYLKMKNLEVLSTSKINEKLLEIGYKKNSFPNKSISLKTEKISFDKNLLNNSTLKLLKQYYAEDYKLIKLLN